jgi:hypothetical protein
MKYYSGTTRLAYEQENRLNLKFPNCKTEIHCFNSALYGEKMARNLAKGFANK